MRKLYLLPLLAAFVALAAASTVNAHSRPIIFDPAPGAVLDAAPAEVTGWFTSDIRRADESYIHVRDADGNPVHTGDVQLSDDRRQMSIALESGLGEGRYLVHWSTFDDTDGEIFSACYNFYVGQAAAEAAIEAGDALDGGAECEASDEHSHEDEMDASSIELSVETDGTSATLEIAPTNFTARAPDGSTVEPGFGHYHIYLDKVPVDVITGEHTHDEGDDHEMEGTATGSTGAMDDMATGSTGAMDDMTEHPGGLVENPVMWVENSYTFTDLEPGVHTVSVVLNYDDHSAYDPPVIASDSFQIEGASSGSDDGGDSGIPAWALALGVVGGLIVGGAGMKLMGSRG